MTKSEFIPEGTSNWNNPVFLLWPALEATKHLGLPVLELGCGHGITPTLKKYCKDNSLELISLDNTKEWADKFGSIYVPDWNTCEYYRREYSVAFVDEAPGENRRLSLKKLHHVKIVVAHDTEPKADHGYQMRGELAKYKFQLDYESPGAWATVVSNFFDVRQFKSDFTTPPL